MDIKTLDNFREKFYKDTETGCWIWTASRTEDGYGQFIVDGQKKRAHRIMWEHENGPIPEGVNVLHNCPCGDNPACVNPDHLWLGTQEDNMIDMSEKKRGSRQLSEVTINEIELLIDKGLYGCDIADICGVSSSAVSKVRRKIKARE